MNTPIITLTTETFGSFHRLASGEITDGLGRSGPDFVPDWVVDGLTPNARPATPADIEAAPDRVAAQDHLERRRGAMPRRKPSFNNHPCTVLSFVADRKATPDCPHRRDFWAVKPTGDWGDDNLIGEAYARDALAYICRTGDLFLLGHVVSSIARRGSTSGIECGFFQVITEALLSGGVPHALRSGACG